MKLSKIPTYIGLMLVTTAKFGILVCGSAESDGGATLKVKEISPADFQNNRDAFANVISHYSSSYCAQSEGHCQGADKFIRSQDVRITNYTQEGNNVDVKLYINDRLKTGGAALTKYQLSEVVYEHSSSIKGDFGKQVDVVEPQRTGWPGWQIAVVTISCVVGVLLIAGIIAGLVYRSRKQKKADDEQLTTNRDVYENQTGKDNTTYTNIDNYNSGPEVTKQATPEAVELTRL